MRIQEIRNAARNWYQSDEPTEGLTESEQNAAITLSECWLEDPLMTIHDDIEVLQSLLT